MRLAALLLLGAGIVLAAAPAVSQEQGLPELERGFSEGRFVDEYFGIAYTAEGLQEEEHSGSAPGPDGLPQTSSTDSLFNGRLPTGLEVEIQLRELPTAASGAACLDSARDGWSAEGREMSDVQIETEPRTRILFVEPGDGDRAGQHGYAFYPRWQQCFSVHIHHVREKRATSREAIEKALANLEMNEAADRFKMAHLVALRSNKDPRLPLVLVEAAADYMQEGPFKNEPLAIRAAGVAFQTAVETKPDDQTFWQVAFTAGSIQIANRRWKDAIASWTKCVELAKTRPNPAHEESLARYNLACTYSRMGRLEAGFEQLEASMALGSEAERANLREHAQKDPDLAKLRTDARWKQLFD